MNWLRTILPSRLHKEKLNQKKMSEMAKEEASPRKQSFLCGVCEGFYGKPWTFAQRQELFKRIQRFGMDTYLYAPKDDTKHRVYWRDLYSQEEADELKDLIRYAEEHNVRFVYALSPGLDIVYSNRDDVIILKKKLDQVKGLGCQSFALLFDDIEDDLCSEDFVNYTSIADAQCSLTNDIYEYLGRPGLFLFCPTEYCTSRTVPDLSKSCYLHTIGSKLDPQVDFLWTGPRVVSRKITVEHITEVSDAVRRPVTIWDNLHANDYDQTRVYLGPYDGRDVGLVQHLRGVLTNPNCEFEANFVAMHTLAQWSQNSIVRFPVSSNQNDVDMEVEEDQETQNQSTVYTPKRALVAAVSDWLPELYKVKTPFGQSKSHTFPTGSQSTKLNEESSEWSDCSKSASNESDRDGSCNWIKQDKNQESRKRFDPLSVSDVVLICDFFYLPFEHGSQASQMLKSAEWLVENFRLLAEVPGKQLMDKGRIEWYDRAIQFHDSYANLSMVVDRFVNIPNRELLYELYTYVNDMRSNLALVNSYIKWHSVDKPEKEPFKSGEQEPWVHRGGLLTEFRRLLPLERYHEGTFNKCPTAGQNSSHAFVVRPFYPKDRDEVYSVCLKTCDDRMDGSEFLGSMPHLAGDCNIGAFLKYFPQYCFVVEDESGICGYVVAANNVVEYNSCLSSCWLPETRQKYPLDNSPATTAGDADLKLNNSISLEAMLKALHADHKSVSGNVLSNYPSFLHMSLLPGRVAGPSTARMLLSSATTALMNSGSRGMHTVLPIGHHADLEFYYRLGFKDITDKDNEIEGSIILAKAIEGASSL